MFALANSVATRGWLVRRVAGAYPRDIRPLVTDSDNARIRGLLATPLGRRHAEAAKLVVAKLNQARIVPAARVPHTVVTMNSRVGCWDDRVRALRDLTLVYPWDAALAKGRVSIFSPLGAELLGAVPGHVLELGDRTLEITFVSYQPEAERAYHQ